MYPWVSVLLVIAWGLSAAKACVETPDVMATEVPTKAPFRKPLRSFVEFGIVYKLRFKSH